MFQVNDFFINPHLGELLEMNKSHKEGPGQKNRNEPLWQTTHDKITEADIWKTSLSISLFGSGQNHLLECRLQVTWGTTAEPQKLWEEEPFMDLRRWSVRIRYSKLQDLVSKFLVWLQVGGLHANPDRKSTWGVGMLLLAFLHYTGLCYWKCDRNPSKQLCRDHIWLSFSLPVSFSSLHGTGPLTSTGKNKWGGMDFPPLSSLIYFTRAAVLQRKTESNCCYCQHFTLHFFLVTSSLAASACLLSGTAAHEQLMHSPGWSVIGAYKSHHRIRHTANLQASCTYQPAPK